MRKTFNFSAGPAVLPEVVLQEAADEMMNYKGSDMSVMEISHRSGLFQSIIDETEADLRQAGHHGSTFGGNPVVCAGSVAVLKQIANSDFLSEVKQKADYFRRELSDIAEISEITGLGLMIGISLSEEFNAAEVAADCIDKGLLILTAKSKLRMLPPLNISYYEINEGINILKAVLDSKK